MRGGGGGRPGGRVGGMDRLEQCNQRMAKELLRKDSDSSLVMTLVDLGSTETAFFLMWQLVVDFGTSRNLL